ncbi:hypothetical protein [Bradyrhizobium sp. USDA 4529]
MWFEPRFNGNTSTTMSNIMSSISATSATMNTTAGQFAVNGFNSFALYNVITGAIGVTLSVGPMGLNLRSTTTVYGVVQSLFGTSTANAFRRAQGPEDTMKADIMELWHWLVVRGLDPATFTYEQARDVYFRAAKA